MQKMRQLALVTLAVVAGALSSARAQGKEAQLLFGFETPAELKSWSLNMPGQDKLALSKRFATSGAHSIVWKTPVWRPGMQQWPTWQTTPAISDWTGYDRLLIDFTNPTDTTTLIRFKAVDAQTAKTPSGNWPGASISIPPRSSRREVFNLDSWMGPPIDRGNITIFLFYTARAPGDYEIYIDNVMLLPPGAEPPALPRRYVDEVASMQVERSAMVRADAALRKALAAMDAAKVEQGAVREGFQRSAAELTDAIAGARRAIKSPELTIERIGQLADEMKAVAQRGDRLVSLVRLAEETDPKALQRGYMVGIAGGTEKVLPRDMPVKLSGKGALELSLARNERESFQVALIPAGREIKGARVMVGELKDDQGRVFPADSIAVRVVGYVKTRAPEYDVSYVGWWPDPLLDFLDKADVADGDAQAFWVRVRAPKDQPAGVYRGTLQITSDNAETSTIGVSVRVRSFGLPDRSPLPLALTTGDEAFFKKYSKQDWAKFKFKYADFLSEYYMTSDNLYRHGPPDMDLIKHHRDNRTLGDFNLGTLDYTVLTPKLSEAEVQAEIDKLITELRPGYLAAREAGVLDRAYIYGFDEVTPDYIPLMQRVTAVLKKEFPEVRLMTTALAADWGPQSGLTDWDIWVPVLTDYDQQRAQKVQAEARQVWWYTCQSPAHPYPNFFTEYTGIEVRLLLGAMTFKAGAQGFLYYSTVRDEGPPREAVTSGPFTTWDACCFRQPYNGEGYWMYPGPDGNPLSSIRLENFRDGIEDYAYLRILQATAQAVRATAGRSVEQNKWLREAESLLAVPASLVKSPHEFSTDPGVLEGYRNRVADAIESAGIPPVAPWDKPQQAISAGQ